MNAANTRNVGFPASIAHLNPDHGVVANDSPKPPKRRRQLRTRLEHMFVNNHRMLKRTLRRRGLDDDAVADTIQETFLVAAERLADIRLGSERAFLIGVALNKALTHRRKSAKWILDDDMGKYFGAGEARGLSAIQLCNMVLSQLDDTLVEVLVLREVLGLSKLELARSLEIPPGTVASRLRRAREQSAMALRRIQQLDATKTDLATRREWWEALRPEHRLRISDWGTTTLK